MKNLLIIFLFISSAAEAQIISFIWHGDTLWARNPLNSDSVQISNKTVPWASVMSKPSTYAVATHSHSISDITNLQSSLDAKGTSNFDGAYSSLTGKPTLFDGTWSSLTGKPSISGTNTGDQDLSGYSLTSHAHTFASLTSKPTTLSGYGITDAVANTTTVNGNALSSNVTISNVATATALQNARTINGVSFDGTANITAPIPVIAQVNLTAQAANIATSTLYAVPSAGFYRVSIYITVTQAATTSSTMPSTTITYTDGNSGTNAHSTTTTATNASNSVTTSFAQTTYVLYAKASTNIQYATGSYASSGGTPMQYALRIRVEAL